MPHVQITMLEGRSTEQIKKVAANITKVLVEDANATPESVVVAFVEVPRDRFARGGVLMSERKP